MSPRTAPPLLAGLQVLATADRSALVAARLLADLGAKVTILEPLGGSPLRTVPPLVGGTGVGWWELTRGATVVAGGDAELAELAQAADVLFDGRSPPRPALSSHPGLISVQLTPFGQSGPRAHWKGGELIVAAASGLLSLVGDPDRAPVRIGGDPLGALTGACAATAACLALLDPARACRQIEVSAQAAAAWATHPTRQLWLLAGQLTRRSGPWRPFGQARRRLIFPCADGYIALHGVLGREWPAFLAWLAEEGQAAPFADPRYAAAAASASLTPGGIDQELVDEVDGKIALFFQRYPKRLLAAEGQRRRIIIFPVNTPSDLLADRQLQARGFFQPVAAPDGQPLQVPGVPARIELGPTAAPPPPRPPTRGQPLAGVRVLDFSWVGAGPLLTLQLAVYGAEVIRIESTLRPDVLRLNPPYARGEPDLEASGYFAPLNASKRSVRLNLSIPAGQALARRLVQRCDVVVESFTPQVMERWGLDYPSLAREAPGIIMLSFSLHGATGPDRAVLGFGTVLSAEAGFAALTGWPDRDPVVPGVPFTDWLAPYAVLPALLAALAQRQRTGQGCYLDCSQLEATLALLREPLLAAQLGLPAERLGNRLAIAGRDLVVPHNVYRCQGEESWVAIACYAEAEWQRLASIVGDPPVAAQAPLPVRQAQREAIDAWLATWCGGRTAE
ncbi:MAG: CoA transferase, partial [Chloroflexi bacterium]|nr:CoA transferase [Chloroflexota bacterium]